MAHIRMLVMTVVKTLFLFSLICDLAQSQFNNTNDTIPIDNESSLTTTTSFYTSEISTTQMEPTQSPTDAPTLRGCSALYSFVHTETLGQISSYPVSFGPLSYEVTATQSAVFPINTSEQPDPCNAALFNESQIENTIVILDGTGQVNCNYQQWTLNMQQLGAKAVLIGVNKPFTTYDGDTSLETPRIPTRLISADDRATLTNISPCCDDVRLSCFDNEYPSVICVEDSEYGKQDFWRINGNYERVNDDLAMANGSSPMWTQDAIFNIGSRRNWQLYFDYEGYFNWVIADTNDSLIVAVCNDAVFGAPSNCSTWHELNSTRQLVSSTTLMIASDVCPGPDADANSTYFCVTSSHADLGDIQGTYSQRIAGIPEWFYESTDGDVQLAVLYWYEDDVDHGWQIAVNGQLKATCVYASYSDAGEEGEGVSPWIRFQPILCTQWTDAASGAVDASFDVDGEQCSATLIDSETQLICVRMATAGDGDGDDDEDGEEWSGVYALETANLTFDRHRVWRLGTDIASYYLLYYDVADAWIIGVDLDIDDADNTASMIAICPDASGDSGDPTECASGTWVVYGDDMDTVEVSVVESSDECALDSSAGGSTATDGFLADFETWEVVLMGGGLFLVVLLIVAVLCCLKRKKGSDVDDHGVTMTPYVPSGMAYDTYQANKSHQQRVSGRNLKAAPTTALSTSGTDQPTPPVDRFSDEALISLFDEDEAQQPATVTHAEDNPFPDDGLIETGQTFNDDATNEWAATDPDVMSAFDEM